MRKRDISSTVSREAWREHRRRRFRRRRRRAYIRSVYSLPSLATLGNAVCGFASMYVSSLDPAHPRTSDQWTGFFAHNSFTVAAYLIFLAMLFDAIDGRLARFTRHTTDFGGQLDSLADVISFGLAPAFLSLQFFRYTAIEHSFQLPVFVTRLIWAIGAWYMCCAALRLARFNVSNEHGEQHHFSFLGLPSPGAGGTVAAFVLMLDDLTKTPWSTIVPRVVWLLPIIVLATALLMVSNIRYPHLVNRYLRGKRSMGRVIVVLAIGLLVIIAHKYALAFGTLIYAFWGLCSTAYFRVRPKPVAPAPPVLPEAPSST